MRTNVRKLLSRVRRKNNQKGFTLIELLVVISILGILAAVVTMSMVGVTRLAQDRAAEAERNTVQSAMDAMASEQLVPDGQVCVGGATNTAGTSDMTTFPGAAIGTDTIPTGRPVALSPRYLRGPSTHGKYFCDANGVVTQVANSFKP